MSSPLHQRNNNNNNNKRHTNSTSRVVAVIGDRPTKRQRRDNPSTPLDHVSLECVATPWGPILTPIHVSTLDKEIILTRIENEIVQPFQLKLSLPRTRISSKHASKQQAAGAAATATAVNGEPPTSKRMMIPPHKSLARRILDSRCHIGINSCTRMIELSLQSLLPKTTLSSSSSVPMVRDNNNNNNNTGRVSLILACRDIYPPTTHAHVPFLIAQQLQQRDELKEATDMDTPVVMLFPGKCSLELGRALGIKKCSILCFTSRNMELEGLRDGLVDCSEEVDKYHAKIDSFVEFCKSKMQSS